MPNVRHILETSLYVENLDRSERFYRDLLGIRTVMADHRMRALRLSDGQMLLLFAKGKSTAGEETPRGQIPGHDGGGQLHLAFAIEEADFDAWRDELAARNIELISHVRPAQGGESLYFRDPDSHLIELATPSIWNV
jgi:catechol 2,3-dioxygenase-like lactoylglutathione lyase family enzyme